jgi:hypothetical protein
MSLRPFLLGSNVLPEEFFGFAILTRALIHGYSRIQIEPLKRFIPSLNLIAFWPDLSVG